MSSEKITDSITTWPGFNAADNPYTSSEFFKICKDYRVPNNPMRYRDEKFYWTYQCGVRYRDQKFYWTYQCGVHWPDDYIGPDSMTRWLIDGFTNVVLYKISESVRAYAYLILSSQASARSGIVGNTTSVLTAQSAFLNNFENAVSRRVDMREDINAGINLTGYHPPRAPLGFCTEMCAQPQGFCTTENAQGPGQ